MAVKTESEITSTLFTSKMAEVANGLSKERCLPAALRAWRTIEGSDWTETLIHITTTLQRGGKQPVSKQAVSHGAAFSCSTFPTGNPVESSITCSHAWTFRGKVLQRDAKSERNDRLNTRAQTSECTWKLHSITVQFNTLLCYYYVIPDFKLQ